MFSRHLNANTFMGFTNYNYFQRILDYNLCDTSTNVSESLNKLLNSYIKKGQRSFHDMVWAVWERKVPLRKQGEMDKFLRFRDKPDTLPLRIKRSRNRTYEISQHVHNFPKNSKKVQNDYLISYMMAFNLDFVEYEEENVDRYIKENNMCDEDCPDDCTESVLPTVILSLTQMSLIMTLTPRNFLFYSFRCFLKNLFSNSEKK